MYYRDAVPLEPKDGVVYLNRGRGSFNIVVVSGENFMWRYHNDLAFRSFVERMQRETLEAYKERCNK